MNQPKKQKGTLTLEQIAESYKKAKKLTKGKKLVLIKYDGWLMSWRFPFIHRYRAIVPKYVKTKKLKKGGENDSIKEN